MKGSQPINSTAWQANAKGEAFMAVGVSFRLSIAPVKIPLCKCFIQLPPRNKRLKARRRESHPPTRQLRAQRAKVTLLLHVGTSCIAFFSLASLLQNSGKFGGLLLFTLWQSY